MLYVLLLETRTSDRSAEPMITETMVQVLFVVVLVWEVRPPKFASSLIHGSVGIVDYVLDVRVLLNDKA